MAETGGRGMSVLIPNMEMPNNCCSCKFASYEGCIITGESTSFECWYEDRTNECPLIPVVDTTPRCPHCGGKIERRGSEFYCFSCHFWWEVDE